MNHKKTLNRISLLFLGTILCISSLRAEDDANAEEAAAAEVVLTPMAEKGMAYFQGSERFENGGPSCISCHNVVHDQVYAGGLFAKDLTDVYERLGEGITGWLGAPPFPAMASSYNNNPLTEEERMNLTAFFKYAYEVKDVQNDRSAFLGFDKTQVKMVVYGLIGLAIMLAAVTVLWSNRKKHMVKNKIFARQNKAWDAKF